MIEEKHVQRNNTIDFQHFLTFVLMISLDNNEQHKNNDFDISNEILRNLTQLKRN